MVMTAVNPEIASVDQRATRTRVVLVVEYDGTNYRGFQWQAGEVTIQQKLEEAVHKLTGEAVRVAAASRTDAGVHARGQVVSFFTGSSLSTDTFLNGLNHYLPEDIVIRQAYRASDSFNVRRRAVSREYKYYILNRRVRSPLNSARSLRVSNRLDIGAMDRAARLLVGEHDFASFTSGSGADSKSTVRRVYRSEVNREGEFIVFNIVASAFLTHQVRNTAGALIRMGLGRIYEAEFCAIMEAKQPGLAGPMAPAHGLCLVAVNYPGSWHEEIVEEDYAENL